MLRTATAILIAGVSAAIAEAQTPRPRLALPDDPLLGFVEVPAGPFLMGTDESQDPAFYFERYELPQRRVTLPTFYIGRYEVTVAQFAAFVENSGYRGGYRGIALDGSPDHPVRYVSWHDALAYCAWLTDRLRAWEGTPEPLANVLRGAGSGGQGSVTLPSEAEWEKAARGTNGRIYPWGTELDPSRANYSATGVGAPTAVGSYPSGASPYGALDMAGNVWEWTRSLWGENRYWPTFWYPYDPADGRENQRASNATFRVMRGGAFTDENVRAAYRVRDFPVDRYPAHRGAKPFRITGFRVVVSPFSF